MGKAHRSLRMGLSWQAGREGEKSRRVGGWEGGKDRVVSDCKAIGGRSTPAEGWAGEIDALFEHHVKSGRPDLTTLLIEADLSWHSGAVLIVSSARSSWRS